MNERLPAGFDLEPERYELQEAPFLDLELARRDFFKAAGGGLIVLLFLPAAAAAQEAGGGRRGRGFGGRMPAEIGAWLHIGEDGAVTSFTGKVEVGQGSRTSLAQAVAEELRVPADSVRMVMGDTALVPFDGGTAGSQTTPAMVPQLRRAAAAARELLIDLAAREWKEDRGLLEAAGGKVIHSRTGQAVDYGKLTRGRKLVEAVGAGAALTPASAWKVCGQPVPRAGGVDLVTGRHRYASDQRLPGMLYGKVLRPPAFGASLVSLDAKEAEAIEGVMLARDGGFAGVAAPSEREAERALAALKAEWKTSPQTAAKDLFEILKQGPGEGRDREGRPEQERGSIEEGLAAADFRLESAYTVAYIAHAPLEHRAALAEWKDGALTVWTGTQRPFGVRGELARALGVPEERVRVIVPDTGSGYGGKHTGEAAVEAARIARAAGKPVKVVWTREEEFTWAYFRPAGLIEVRSGVKKDGAITAWEFRNYNSGASAIRPLYDIPNLKVEFRPSRSPLRQGSYRALAATANHFARESHLDELARQAGIDPLELRRRNLKDPRLLAVLAAAAERFGWGRARAAGRGFGIAAGFEKGSYVAYCAEVAAAAATGKPAPEVKVERLVTAFECGAILNPDNLRNQVEGAVIMGLGGALFEAIEFEDGRILNPRFSEYRVPRFGDVPVLDTVLLDRKDLPSAGAGETPIVGVAPAIANAIFDAIGLRLRSMPLLKSRG
ncbi:MAG: xanthine dehydrogenase family protein molybdopterin-binding subunit [Planctomycetes bacterium]|nr:xanthine dehydrogenase family protein molybdopterin-binding subunit [Planctomycetota bacterium]